MLTLNIFHTFLYCLCCWLWRSNLRNLEIHEFFGLIFRDNHTELVFMFLIIASNWELQFSTENFLKKLVFCRTTLIAFWNYFYKSQLSFCQVYWTESLIWKRSRCFLTCDFENIFCKTENIFSIGAMREKALENNS